MAGYFLNTMQIVWKCFSTRFDSILQGTNWTRNSRSKTTKNLIEERTETERDFLYLKKQISSNNPDQKKEFQNSDNQKKYHLLSPQ